MKELITQVLSENNAVNIPGLGGFTATYKPATLDHVQGRMSPPAKAFQFNRNLMIDDGLLVQHISEAKQITVAQARQELHSLVADLQARLDQREILDFPGLGRLYRDFEGNYQFLQSNEMNFNLESYGLPALQFQPILRNQHQPLNEAPKPREESTILQLNKNSKSTTVANWFQQAAPYLVAATILIIIGTLWLLQRPSIQNTPFILPVSKERVNQKPTLDHVEETEDFSDAIEEAYVTEELNGIAIDYTDDLDNIDTEGATYSPAQQESIIIIGTFAQKSNVEKLVRNITYAGHEPWTKVEKGLTRVGIIFGYDDLSEVTTMQRQLSNEFDVNAWVMQPRNK